MNATAAIVAIGAILLTIASVTFLIWLLYRLVRAVFRLLWGAATAERTPLDLLLGAAVASIVFPQVPRAIVHLVAAFFSGSFAALRSLFGQTLQRAAAYCSSGADQCTPSAFALSETLLAAAEELIRGLLARPFPLVSTILFCATWALMAYAASSVRERGKVPVPPGFDDDKGALWRGAALTAVAFLGAYLSVTAVMAIPLFDDANRQVASRFTADALKADMEQVQPVQIENGRISGRAFPPLNPATQTPAQAGPTTPIPQAGPAAPATAEASPPAPPRAEGAAAEVSSPDAAVPAPPVAAPAPEPAIASPAQAAAAGRPAAATTTTGRASNPAADLRQLMEVEYGRLIAAHESQEEDANRSAQVYRQSALASFIANNEGRLGARERARHYDDLYTWYRRQVGSLRQHLGGCAAAISRFATYARQLPHFLGQGEEDLDYTYIFEVQTQAVRVAGEADMRCSARRVPETDMPSRKDYGEFLGAVGVTARWLLSTESREVALIVGLVGFGILGAFVSWLADRKPGEQVKYGDVGSVLLRGFGAAVVVFLGSYGGLAAIAQNAQQPYPNPYVVFFLCLVGAVFSNDVWQWAKTKLPTKSPP